MIMDLYEQKYKKALEAVKFLQEVNPSDEGIQNWVKDNFPELKESDNEQSKNWILDYLYDGLRRTDEQFKDEFKAAISWLENQGKKQSIWTDSDRVMAFTLMRDIDLMTYISDEGKNERLKWLNSLEDKFNNE